MTSPDIVAIAAGDYTARILPAVGGSMARLQWRGRDLLQVYPEDAVPAAGFDQLACFVMVPFAGRIKQTRFTWRGEEHRLAKYTDEAHAMHGDGWMLPWDIVAASEAQVTLALDHREGPLPFHAQMTYALGEEGLTITTSLTSLASAPMPYGMGQHPWFPREAGAQLRFAAKRFWLADPGSLPSQSIALPPELDFAHGGEVPRTWRDNCYEGWDGLAEIIYPESGHKVIMTAQKPLDWLMFYANPDCLSFCLEPQSHLPAAHNMEGEALRLGLTELEPGETLCTLVRIGAELL